MWMLNTQSHLFRHVQNYKDIKKQMASWRKEYNYKLNCMIISSLLNCAFDNIWYKYNIIQSQCWRINIPKTKKETGWNILVVQYKKSWNKQAISRPRTIWKHSNITIQPLLRGWGNVSLYCLYNHAKLQIIT